MGDVSFADVVGKTPLVRVKRVLPDEAIANDVRVLLKLEMQNPGGSVKDRIAKSIIEEAEKNGTLKSGGTVVEYTSGNTGIGLSMICASKGYKCIIVMPQLPLIQERYIICRQFGSQVHLTAPALGFAGLKAHAEQLIADNPDYILANQFYNEANPAAHYDFTGPEIWEQAGGKVDYFVSGIGTGGTVTGAGKYLYEMNPDIKIVAVEPTESRVCQGATHSPHTVLGIGAGVPAHFIESLEPGKPMEPGPRGHISEFGHASSDEAVDWAKRLAQKEGIMVGPSSGAAMKVAADLAKRPEAAGKTIVVLTASHGIRYCSHPLWSAVQLEAVEALPSPPNLSKDVPCVLYRSPQ